MCGSCKKKRHHKKHKSHAQCEACNNQEGCKDCKIRLMIPSNCPLGQCKINGALNAQPYVKAPGNGYMNNGPGYKYKY